MFTPLEVPRAGKMKLVLALHSAPALLLLLLLTLAEPQKQGAEALPVTCCLRTCDIKVKRDLLRNYSIQDQPLCPVKAVRFVTKRNNTLCLDPSSTWVINTIAFLDSKATLRRDSTD